MRLSVLSKPRVDGLFCITPLSSSYHYYFFCLLWIFGLYTDV